MTKRLAGVSVAVVLLAICAIVGQQSLTQPDLTWDPAAYGFRFLAELDEDYTFTKGVIYNRSDRPIELRDVRVGSVSRGVTLLGVSVAASDDFQDSPLVFGPSYPPPGVAAADARTPRGFVVAPGEGIRVLVGLRLTSPGVHELQSVTLDYGSSLLGRSATLHYAVRVCAPSEDFWGPNRTVVSCDAPDPPT